VTNGLVMIFLAEQENDEETLRQNLTILSTYSHFVDQERNAQHSDVRRCSQSPCQDRATRGVEEDV
jgi:hypothetical protein